MSALHIECLLRFGNRPFILPRPALPANGRLTARSSRSRLQVGTSTSGYCGPLLLQRNKNPATMGGVIYSTYYFFMLLNVWRQQVLNNLIVILILLLRQSHKLLQVRTSGISIQTIGDIARSAMSIARHRQRHDHVGPGKKMRATRITVAGTAIASSGIH